MIEDPGQRQAEDFGRRQREIEQTYRYVFGSVEGRRVLGDILSFCHFGKLLSTDEERIEYNVGIAIARMSGIMSQVDVLAGITKGD
jgi:hypothetical protein